MKRSLVLFLTLGACVSAPKRPAPPPPVVRPAPAPLPPPPPVAWEDRARTPGDWSWQAGAARFGDAVTMMCHGGGVTITRTGATGSLTIRTTTLARTLRADERLDPNDPLLDAIAFSRGKWLLASPGLPDLILPPWPEIARVVEDCRG